MYIYIYIYITKLGVFWRLPRTSSLSTKFPLRHWHTCQTCFLTQECFCLDRGTLGFGCLGSYFLGSSEDMKQKQIVKSSRSSSADKTGKLIIQFNWRFIQLLFFCCLQAWRQAVEVAMMVPHCSPTSPLLPAHGTHHDMARASVSEDSRWLIWKVCWRDGPQISFSDRRIV